MSVNEVITKIESIQEASNRQGENLVRSSRAMEQAVAQIQDLVESVRRSPEDYEDKKYILQGLYAITATLTDAAIENRFNA